MDPGCFGKIISCLRLTALAKDRGCDVQTWSDSVVIEPSQSRCFDRMVVYLQIEDTVFDGILERRKGMLERREEQTAGPLRKTIRRFSEQLTEWVGTPPRTWKLLYRGSRDGFTGRAFHAACDGKGDNAVFVQDTHKSVFGGYSSVSWASNEALVESPGAFLFSLSRKGVLDPTAAIRCSFTIPGLPQGRSAPAVYCSGNQGPIWREAGGTYNGCAFVIRDKCNTSNKSNITLSHTLYGDPYLLTGGHGGNGGYFTVQDIEEYACDDGVGVDAI